MDDLISVVATMTDPLSLDEAPVSIGTELTHRLTDVATAHGGKVRLHSRLFAQWLHYVFPRDCSFPHKSGTVSTASATEYRGAVLVSTTERLELAEAATESMTASVDVMSQWNDEEELLAGYSQHVHSTKSSRDVVFFVGCVLVLLIGGIGSRQHTQKDSQIVSGERHAV